MKFFPSGIRINKKLSDQQVHNSPPGGETGKSSDAKEVLLLSSGLLVLVLGIGGLLMYSEEEPHPATASQPVEHVELAKAFSSPMDQPDVSGPPSPETSPLFSDLETNPSPVDSQPSVLTGSPTEPATVNFAFEKAELTEEAKFILNNQVSHLPKEWEGTLRIEGHTDLRGSDSYNRALGAKRAETVKTYLVSLGISQDRIQTDSFGKDSPICQEDTSACHEQNRRAKVEWLNSSVSQSAAEEGQEPLTAMTSPPAIESSIQDSDQPTEADSNLMNEGDSSQTSPVVNNSESLDQADSKPDTGEVIPGPETQP